MIDVARIDYWAASGTGPYHRASIPAKVFFLLLVLAAALTARSAYALASCYCLILIVAAGAGLPWLRILTLSLYAAVFTVLYMLSMRGSMLAQSVLILKAVTPAFAVLMLIMSTPYPRIFAFLSTVLPEIIAAGLFMTYRTLFILIEMMGNFMVGIRLRGGFSPGSLSKNVANISKGMGMVLVRAVERSSRLYAVMAVRGFSGSMAERASLRLRKDDWLPIAAGVGAFIVAQLGK